MFVSDEFDKELSQSSPTGTICSTSGMDGLMRLQEEIIKFCTIPEEYFFDCEEDDVRKGEIK